jgi:hypothetical protein
MLPFTMHIALVWQAENTENIEDFDRFRHFLYNSRYFWTISIYWHLLARVPNLPVDAKQHCMQRPEVKSNGRHFRACTKHDRAGFRIEHWAMMGYASTYPLNSLIYLCGPSGQRLRILVPFFSSLLLESGLAIIMPQHAPLQEPILYPTTLRWLGLGPCLFWPTLSFFGESGLHSICQLFFPRTWRGIDWAKVDGRLQMGCDQKKTIRGGSASLSCPWKILNFVLWCPMDSHSCTISWWHT